MRLASWLSCRFTWNVAVRLFVLLPLGLGIVVTFVFSLGKVLATPSPRDKRGSAVSGAPSPSQILFTHEEIVVLKLLFSLFDRKGKVRSSL